MSIHTLLNNIFYNGVEGVVEGFILFNNEKVVDIGERAKPEYELSELVIDYGYRAYALHGYSLAIDPSKYLVRGLNEDLDLSIYSDNELEKIVYAVLYEMYLNGITLPVLFNELLEIVNRVVKEHSLEAVIVHDEGTLKHYTGIIYVERRGDKLYVNDRELGSFDKLFCTIQRVSSECVFIDISGLPTLNTSTVIYELSKNIGVNSAIKLLINPYRVLGMDHGVLENGCRPDILVYDLRDSRLTIPRQYVEYVVLRGYPPSQVFVKGDTFFDHGESLVLTPSRIDDILFKARD